VLPANTAYIGVGSNVGNRKVNIEKAIELVKAIEGVKFEKSSSIYETESVGCVAQEKFLNGVCKLATTLEPFKLLEELKKIEKILGRKEKGKNLPRTIDLDILLFGDKKISTEDLKIPHPRMHEREFVLKGLREFI